MVMDFLFILIMLPITAFVIGISIIILLQCVKYGLNKGGDRDEWDEIAEFEDLGLI